MPAPFFYGNIYYMLTQQQVQEAFTYKDGGLYWKIRPTNAVSIGERAGTLNKNGYRSIQVYGCRTKEHRIIFLYHHGYLPDEVDHKDRVKTNNRIENLREATRSQNAVNGPGIVTATSKNKRVSKKRKKWRATVTIDNKSHHIGTFDNEEQAAKAYDDYVQSIHGEFAKTNL